MSKIAPKDAAQRKLPGNFELHACKQGLCAR